MLKFTLLVAIAVIQIAAAEKPESRNFIAAFGQRRKTDQARAQSSPLLQKLRDEILKRKQNSSQYVEDMTRAIRSQPRYALREMRTLERRDCECSCSSSESCSESSSESSCSCSKSCSCSESCSCSSSSSSSSSSSEENEDCKLVNVKKLHHNLQKIANIMCDSCSEECSCDSSSDDSCSHTCSCKVCNPNCVACVPAQRKKSVFVPVYDVQTAPQYGNYHTQQPVYAGRSCPSPNSYNGAATNLYHQQGFGLENKPVGYIKPCV